MGKKHTIKYLRTGKIEIIDEDDCSRMFTEEDYIKSGMWGRDKQYKYFCEHPEEIEDEKLFSEWEEEFGNGDIEEI